MRIFIIVFISLISVSLSATETLSLGKKSICRGDDSRNITKYPFAARVVEVRGGNSQCSATLIGNNCMITAGHCVSITKVIEFNVPLSQNNRLVAAAPEDQYDVDLNSIEHKYAGLGDDWAVFKIEPNRITGLTAEQAQGGFVEVDFQVPHQNTDLRITGYGNSADRTRRGTQQTAFGHLENNGETNPNQRTYMEYEVDTTPGSSGSGVIDRISEKLIGVHTNGGCRVQPDTYNKGVSLALNEEFQKAVLSCLGR